MIKKTYVLSMYGAPGAGKSTLAAELFALLKKSGDLAVELVTEYAKDAVYSRNAGALGDQMYLTSKHNHRLMRLQGKVNLVITDSSLLNAVIYCDYYTNDIEQKNAIIASKTALELFEMYNNIGIFVPRKKAYQSFGRTQTEEESNEIESKVSKFVKNISTSPVYVFENNSIDKLANDLTALIK